MRSAGLLAAIGAACASVPSGAPAPVAAPAVDRSLLPEGCADLHRFKALASEAIDDLEVRAALARWTPGARVPDADRDRMHTVVRYYIRRCGLAEAIALTRELIAFPTVSAEAPAPDHPAFSRMAERLEAYAKEAGLGFSVYGAHDAWELSLGDGPALLGFVMHADVVPVRETVGSSLAPSFSDVSLAPPDWSSPPFRAELRGDRLYGRGAEDDKGPIAAALVAMRALSRLGMTTRGKVLAILGTGEEHDWSGMKRYVEAKRPPVHVISVDAAFPVVIAEAGFVAWSVGIPRGPSDRVASSLGPKIVDAHAGQFLTQVPGEATMDVIPTAGQGLDALYAQLAPIAHAAAIARGAPFSAELARRGDGVRVIARGTSVHSSTADKGHNPLWLLAEIAHEFRPAPSAVSRVLEIVAARLAGEHDGKKLGLAYAHPMMGALLVAPTLLRSDERAVTLGVNMRRPAGRAKEDFEAALDRALVDLKAEIDTRIEELAPRYVGEPAIAELEGVLVPTLMDIWTRGTGAPARPTTIRGGTYARLFPGAVSFGPAFPDQPYRGHAPDEYIELDALAKTTELLLEASIRLADGARAP